MPSNTLLAVQTQGSIQYNWGNATSFTRARLKIVASLTRWRRSGLSARTVNASDTVILANKFLCHWRKDGNWKLLFLLTHGYQHCLSLQLVPRAWTIMWPPKGFSLNESGLRTLISASSQNVKYSEALMPTPRPTSPAPITARDLSPLGLSWNGGSNGSLYHAQD